ncbi:MAG: hypothetical protein VCE75_17465 [Alphaproteobacteria bacterium]
MEDVFELQDDIVTSIAATVGPEITFAEIERARGKQPGTLDAWDHYLRGLAAYHKMTKDGLSDAVSHLSEVVDIEPDFADAYAQLGQCHFYIALNGWVRPVRNGFEEAKRLGEEAVRLAPSSPQTNYALAHALAATGQTERAIDLNRNFAEAYAVLGLALVFFGETEEGLTACLRAIRSNPRDARGSLLFSGLAMPIGSLATMNRPSKCRKKVCTNFKPTTAAWSF